MLPHTDDTRMSSLPLAFAVPYRVSEEQEVTSVDTYLDTHKHASMSNPPLAFAVPYAVPASCPAVPYAVSEGHEDGSEYIETIGVPVMAPYPEAMAVPYPEAMAVPYPEAMAVPYMPEAMAVPYVQELFAMVPYEPALQFVQKKRKPLVPTAEQAIKQAVTGDAADSSNPGPAWIPRPRRVGSLCSLPSPLH